MTPEAPSYFELMWETLAGFSGEKWVFLVFAALAVGSAVATITRRNAVVAAVWLVATFFSVAACYVLLSATFLAAIQVLVYAGAMMVLFVFVVMVLDVDETGRTEHRKPSRIGRFGYYLALGAVGLFLTWVMLGTLSRQYLTPGVELDPGTEFGTANALGRELFRDYLFAFEGISLLLLAAVIGAVVVARSRREREKQAAAQGLEPAALHAAGLTGEEQGEDFRARGASPFTNFGVPSAGGHDGGV